MGGDLTNSGTVNVGTGFDRRFGGSQFTYSYYLTGTLLLSATGPNGTTTYAYNGDAVAVTDNALAEITNPDGRTNTFSITRRHFPSSMATTVPVS